MDKKEELIRDQVVQASRWLQANTHWFLLAREEDTEALDRLEKVGVLLGHDRRYCWPVKVVNARTPQEVSRDAIHVSMLKKDRVTAVTLQQALAGVMPGQFLFITSSDTICALATRDGNELASLFLNILYAAIQEDGVEKQRGQEGCDDGAGRDAV